MREGGGDMRGGEGVRGGGGDMRLKPLGGLKL